MKAILAPVAAALALAAALSAQQPAATEAQPVLHEQTLCPVGGDPVDKSVYADYEGQRVYFCCPKCVKKFQEFPDGVLFAMYKEGVRPENIQATCPVSGEPLENHDNFTDILNKRVYTCCPKCLVKVKAEPARYLDILEGRQVQTKCPIRGGDISKDAFTLVQGQKVYFCCPGCDKKFTADADKYFASMAAKKVVTESANAHCPIMTDEEVDPAVFVTWQGRRIHFCCPDCITKFAKDPQKYVARL